MVMFSLEARMMTRAPGMPASKQVKVFVKSQFLDVSVRPFSQGSPAIWVQEPGDLYCGSSLHPWGAL